MTNSEIAQFLYEISEMLELKGENLFRVGAYRRAAKSVEHLGGDLEDLYKKGGLSSLEEIEGIGESIALKVAELLETGKCQYYDDLSREIPKSELSLMKIPGIGAKKAKKLYQNLKIKSIDDLEKAAVEGKIRQIEGFEEKTEENILKNIDRLKKREKRLLISFAFPIAREMLNYLKKCPQTERVDVVGSLRRFKETIGDIDLVAASKNPQVVIEWFCRFPQKKEIISQGETKASILHQKGETQIDLEILKPDSYGSLLQHLTGSKEHNIALRQYANKIGLSLSEYGILNLSSKKREIFSKEENFYKRLGLSYIPPELREARGEIEAARKKKLPDLVKLPDLKGDLHIHTKWSEGSLTIEEVAKSASSRGLEYIAICDHSSGLGITKGVDEEKLRRQIEEIQKVNQKMKPSHFKILSGVEVNIKADGSLDLSSKILEKLDLVVASVHSSFDQTEEKMTTRLISAIENPQVDILGHPSGRILLKREPYDVIWEKIFQKAKEAGTILEINCHPERLDLNDNLIFEAHKLGIKFAISSDTHQEYHLDQLIYGVAQARRGWLTTEDVINTLSLEDFLKFLSRPQKK